MGTLFSDENFRGLCYQFDMQYKVSMGTLNVSKLVYPFIYRDQTKSNVKDISFKNKCQKLMCKQKLYV